MKVVSKSWDLPAILCDITHEFTVSVFIAVKSSNLQATMFTLNGVGVVDFLKMTGG